MDSDDLAEIDALVASVEAGHQAQQYDTLVLLARITPELWYTSLPMPPAPQAPTVWDSDAFDDGDCIPETGA